MSYDNAQRMVYSFGPRNFATTQTMRVQGPSGKAGKVFDYGVSDVTIAFTATTTAAVASVGRAGALSAYGANQSIGAAPVGGGVSMRSKLTSLGQLNVMVPAQIAKDTEVVFTVTAPTGGTPAGTGTPFLVIDWDW